MLLALAIAGCGPDTVSRDWHRVEPPIAAPDFILPALGGGSVSLSALRGRVVIVEFWATWCGPCRFSLPSLEVISKRFHQRGATVLLVNAGETESQVRTWAGWRFTAPILLDDGHRVEALYGVRGMPQLYVINQDGKIIYVHQGYGGGLEYNLGLILKGLLEPHHTAHHG